jgi:hypothetical protein
VQPMNTRLHLWFTILLALAVAIVMVVMLS